MTAADNIAAMQRFYAAFMQGDLDALRALVSDDFVLSNDFTARVPTAGEFHGKDGVVRFFEILAEVIAEVHAFVPDEFIASGDKVAVLGHERMTVRPTGRTVDARWVQVGTFRNGLMSRFDEYSDTAAWDVGFMPRET
jgi:ketosteroid isomerase-like protein